MFEYMQNVCVMLEYMQNVCVMLEYMDVIVWECVCMCVVCV